MTRLLTYLVAFVAVVALGGCGASAVDDAPSKPGRQADQNARPRAKAEQPPRAGTAAAALGRLVVKGRAAKTGYDREQFGGDWATVNGCDVRDRILARDLADDVRSRCEVQSGSLADPYTAARIGFVRGGASEVDIDHVVALGDAWQKGAQQWSYSERVQFANDPLNLLAVGASANRQKGDSDAASWLPPNKAFRCAYVARQIAVKRRYKAWVTKAEKDAMSRVLAGCSGQALPTSRRLQVPVAPKPEPTAEPQDGGGEARYFENCDAVRAAGLAPLTRGDGIYEHNTHMDRDGDGVACE